MIIPIKFSASRSSRQMQFMPIEDEIGEGDFENRSAVQILRGFRTLFGNMLFRPNSLQWEHIGPALRYHLVDLRNAIWWGDWLSCKPRSRP